MPHNHFNIILSDTFPRTYPVLIEKGILSSVKRWLPQNTAINQLVIITDNRVKKLFGEALYSACKKAGFKIHLLAFSGGEQAKTHTTKQCLEEQMLKLHCDRQTLILALGGGVVGDLAGFIAATYFRGIPYVQIPTTLLAMIDSSIGGKTGINNEYGKNLIGAVWQPRAVIMDINCLSSLPLKQIMNGIFEALKIALIRDEILFDYMKKNKEKIKQKNIFMLKKIIGQAVRLKAEVIMHDECDVNERKSLNFGHTIGHALENLSDYRILHGFAVGLGMLVEAKIAVILGLLPENKFLYIKNLLAYFGIKSVGIKKFSSVAILKQTKHDKKTDLNCGHYVLLSDVGQLYTKNQRYTHAVADQIVIRALEEV